MITCCGNWHKLRIASISLVFVAVISLIGCNSPTYVPIPSPSSPSPTPTPTPEPSTSVTSPPITIALDYFGVRNTHWIPQVGGDPLAKIQLIAVVSDEQATLAVWPPQSGQNLTFDMDFFQVKALKEKMDPPVVFNGPVTGTLVVYVAAYNVNKGPITKAQIDMLSKWLGFPELDILKAAIPDRELVGYYWQTWSPSSNWGIGKHYDGGDGDLRVWLRIGSGQMPEAAQQPVLKPNVKIEGKLPAGVRVRTTFFYNESDFAFTLTNNESFGFPIYWHLESPSNPGTEINYVIYPTEGKQDVPANSSATIHNKYWFTTPGDYKWKYVAEYPKGNPVASWEGTLKVSP